MRALRSGDAHRIMGHSRGSHWQWIQDIEMILVTEIRPMAHQISHFPRMALRGDNLLLSHTSTVSLSKVILC
jgi:hypothetical protein